MIVYLYGPPASGKLTVGRELSRLLDYPLLHNHVTIDAVATVFEFGSAPFTDALHRVRLDIVEVAAQSGRGLIVTNNSAWADGPAGNRRFRDFVGQVETRVRGVGGEILLVRLSAPAQELARRVGAASRHELGKLTDSQRLRELLATADLSPIPGTDMSFDTSQTSPEEAAAQIASAILRRG